MEELFNGQLSFADIEAEKFLQIRRTHADRRVNAMDRLTDDVINELIQGSSSKTPVAKPDGTKLFRSAFLNDARMCCFFCQHNSKMLL